MREPIPDRVSLDPDSPHFFPEFRKIGVRLNGKEIVNCAEFCVSEGWTRRIIPAGNRLKFERGKPLAVRVHGTVEPFWRKAS